MFVIRPHPGLDPNGWGSSLYLQPFLPGATLGGTSVTSYAIETNRVKVYLKGRTLNWVLPFFL